MKVAVKFTLYIVSLIIEAILYAIAFIFSIWTNRYIKILFYINLILVFMTVIYSLVFIFIYLISKMKLVNPKVINYSFKIFKHSNKILYFIIFFSNHILNYYNNNKFETYSKECPFTLTSDLNSNNSSNFETKRCELYNIYDNSRYKYQYICSYNPYDVLKYKKTKDGLQKIQCVPKVNDLKEFEIIDKFTQIYQEMNISQLFYCNLVEMPMKNDFIPEKDCNNKVPLHNKFNILFQISSLIAFIFKNLYKDLVVYMIKRIEYEILIEIQNYLRKEEEDCSTDNDESNSNNASFIEEDEINVIVENNSVHNIDVNITDLVENEQKGKLD